MMTTVQKGGITCCAERLGFLPVAIETLMPSNSLPFDLFLRTDSQSSPLLYRERRLPFDYDDLNRLVEQGVHTLYIRVADHVAYRNYLRETILHNKEVPATKRFKILETANRSIFHLAFYSRNPELFVRFSAEYGDELTNIVCDDTLVVRDLLPLMTHDYYTYTHATNVCTLSLILGVGLGLTPQDGLAGLAAAALLHDLGKKKIAPAILNQKRPLRSEQKEIVRRHPQWGFQELCNRHDVLSDQLMVVYQHHERWDGRGYPVGLVEEEIHSWARICAVADAYEAMSSARPYRPAMSQRDIWKTMEREANRQFDGEMVKCLKSVVRPFA